MSESRELRNKRIAIDAANRLARIDGDEFASFQKHWEARGITWLRPAREPYDPDDWLPATEMAARSDVAPETVRRWHLRGHITAQSFSGLLHYNVGEVVAYLAKRDHAHQGR